MSQPAIISKKAGIGTAATAGLRKHPNAAAIEAAVPVQIAADVPAAPASEVEAATVPRDPEADAKRAGERMKKALDAEHEAEQKAKEYAVEAQAYEAQMEADSNLASARRQVKETKAAAEQARKHVEHDVPDPHVKRKTDEGAKASAAGKASGGSDASSAGSAPASDNAESGANGSDRGQVGTKGCLK